MRTESSKSSQSDLGPWNRHFFPGAVTANSTTPDARRRRMIRKAGKLTQHRLHLLALVAGHKALGFVDELRRRLGKGTRIVIPNGRSTKVRVSQQEVTRQQSMINDPSVCGGDEGKTWASLLAFAGNTRERSGQKLTFSMLHRVGMCVRCGVTAR